MVVLQNFLILTISAACYKILLFFVHSYKSNSIIFDCSKLAVFGEKNHTARYLLTTEKAFRHS